MRNVWLLSVYQSGTLTNWGLGSGGDIRVTVVCAGPELCDNKSFIYRNWGMKEKALSEIYEICTISTICVLVLSKNPVQTPLKSVVKNASLAHYWTHNTCPLCTQYQGSTISKTIYMRSHNDSHYHETIDVLKLQHTFKNCSICVMFSQENICSRHS